MPQRYLTFRSCLLGMAVGYWIDMKWIRFKPEATFVGQILKCVLGKLVMDKDSWIQDLTKL